MASFRHFTKESYQNCNRTSTAYLGVVTLNHVLLSECVELFEYTCKSRGISVNEGLRQIRSSGVIISKPGLYKAKRGYFNTMSITWCNILMDFCGVRLGIVSNPSVGEAV